MALFVLVAVGIVVAQTWLDWRDSRKSWVLPDWAKGLALGGTVTACMTAAASYATVWIQDPASNLSSSPLARTFWPELAFLACVMGVIVAAVVWGLAIVGFGVIPGLTAALAFLALAGAADAMSGLFRSVIWNQTIPDSLRGRLASIELLSYSIGPTLGNFEAGVVASAFSVRTSIVSGGMLCVIGCVLCAAALPAFRSYDSRQRPATTPSRQ